MLIAGLGNPGHKYDNTRHNVGFMALDYFCKTYNLTFTNNKNLESQVAFHQDSIFAKPQTYMNLSGNAIQKIVAMYSIDRILIIHDDLDLEMGVIKTKFAGSSGGHNGLKSIDEQLSNNYFRLRIGIGRPSKSIDTNIIDYVLGKFSSNIMDNISNIFCVTNNIIEAFVNNETLVSIQNKYNTRVESDF